jgi:hypothetical protein
MAAGQGFTEGDMLALKAMMSDIKGAPLATVRDLLVLRLWRYHGESRVQSKMGQSQFTVTFRIMICWRSRPQ